MKYSIQTSVSSELAETRRVQCALIRKARQLESKLSEQVDDYLQPDNYNYDDAPRFIEDLMHVRFALENLERGKAILKNRHLDDSGFELVSLIHCEAKSELGMAGVDTDRVCYPRPRQRNSLVQSTTSSFMAPNDSQSISQQLCRTVEKVDFSGIFSHLAQSVLAKEASNFV